MGRAVKTIKSSSKKFLKEADVPEYSDEIIDNDNESLIQAYENEPEDEDDDDAPEAVSTSTSKAEIITQIKSEREARRVDREMKRQKVISLQEQNRLARLRKAKEVEAEKDKVSDDNEEKVSNGEICPLPENIFEDAILQKQQQLKLHKNIRFESENESDKEETNFINSAEIIETVRQQRAKATKRRLVESLPFSVVEVGLNGKARISRAEIKARRAISKLKMERAGSQVRRIDSVLDRARKSRTAPNVFYRKNSFY